MARESKGKQVKTFKHFEPQPDLSYVEQIGKVYFEAGTGNFCIYLPDHIAALVSKLPAVDREHDTRGVQHGRGYIYGNVMQNVLKSHEGLLKDFVNYLRNVKREKVISVEFKYNLRWIADFHKPRNSLEFASWNGGGKKHEISFCGNPAINLSYRILYRVNGDLFELVNEGKEGEYLSHKGKAGTGVIAWTEEREAFFAQTVGNIERLIMAMITFMDDIEGSIDKAIAGGGLMSLPAPKPAAD